MGYNLKVAVKLRKIKNNKKSLPGWKKPDRPGNLFSFLLRRHQ